MAGGPDIATFTPLVGEEFSVGLEAGGGDPVLRLLEVSPLPSWPGAPRADPFSLVFAGRRGIALAQGIYSVSHPGLGSLDLFLVPIAPDATGDPLYESVFN